MAGITTEESGAGSSLEEVSSAQQQCQSGEALAEWRSSEQVENGIPSTSPPYWDSDDDDDNGPKPSELYGKYTWKIDKFSQINKRELRSNAFEVGGYKWYILIYPQGCDVCNHLSLFLCVANHDKLLPGWSHFAQFTIAVVNKDPKKSKYSDTLHRFWKKEHDWGWKKFMELSKVLDGFIDADTLIIKAQVQVIRERADRPFRCLDCQYRRELIRVYLTNVEQICRRFVEERRGKLGKLLEDKARWSSFCSFWLGMDQSARRRMSRDRTDSILKIVVKHFFIEKEVTSTLVMDSLYSGLKALEGQNKGKKGKGKYLEGEESPVPIIRVEKDMFVLVDDVLLLLERAALEPLPPKDEKGPQNRTKDGAAGEEFNKDSIERDERRLTELGRRTIEIFILAHIFSKIEVAYQEAVAFKRQEELIREEVAESEQKAKRGADKEKKSKKKQGKQKRNNRKAKDKGKDDKLDATFQDRTDEGSPTRERNSNMTTEQEMVLEKPDALEDISDVSDSLESILEILPLESEDKEVNHVNWEPDTHERHLPVESSASGSSGLSGVPNGLGGRSPSAVDDSSSTCSSDSVPFVTITSSYKGSSPNSKNQKSTRRGRKVSCKTTSAPADWADEAPSQSIASSDVGQPNDSSVSSERIESLAQSSRQSSQDKVAGLERQTVKKEEDVSLSKYSSAKDMASVETSSMGKISGLMSPPKSPAKIKISAAPSKSESKLNVSSAPVLVKKLSSDSVACVDRSTRLMSSAEDAITSKPDSQKVAASKPDQKLSGQRVAASAEKSLLQQSPHSTGKLSLQVSVTADKHSVQHMPITTEKPSTTQMPVMTRPLSAPIVPGPRPTVSMVSMVQTAPPLARSVSAVGLGPEPLSSAQNYVQQSYRNVMMGSPVTGSLPAYTQHHSPGAVVTTSNSYSQLTSLVSAPLFPAQIPDRMEPNSTNPTFSFGANQDVLPDRSTWMEYPPQRDGRIDVPGDHSTLQDHMLNFDLYKPIHSRFQDRLPSELIAGSSRRQSHVVSTDEFPHLDIINDLLDDEQGVGFSNVHHLNRQFSFLSEIGMSGGPAPSTSSCRSERTRSYHDDALQHGYDSSGRGSFDTSRTRIHQDSPQPYINGQVDGVIPNQWQIAGSDLSFLNFRNTDSDGYPYHVPGVNGYTIFRPSNGH